MALGEGRVAVLLAMSERRTLFHLTANYVACILFTQHS